VAGKSGTATSRRLRWYDDAQPAVSVADQHGWVTYTGPIDAAGEIHRLVLDGEPLEMALDDLRAFVVGLAAGRKQLALLLEQLPAAREVVHRQA
jgi:hypothetical protein